MEENLSKTISIIIPVYNVSVYIQRCIRSIVNQTYQNIELIIVDDGSTDRSGDICDGLASLDGRIRVFHKENGGLASARNFGLDKVAGEYIGFVDGDDFIEEKMFERLLFYLIKNDADLATCDIIRDWSDRYVRRTVKSNRENYRGKYKRWDAIKEMLKLRAFDLSVCNKLFKKELFRNIRFPEGAYSEDMPVIYECLKRCQYAVNDGYADYHYVQRSNSITTAKFHPGRLDALRFGKEIYDDVLLNHANLKEEAHAFCVSLAIGIAYKIKMDDLVSDYRSVYSKLQDDLKLESRFIAESSLFSESDKERHQEILNNNHKGGKVEGRKNAYQKQIEFYEILLQWVHRYQKKQSTSEFFSRCQIDKVAIYGMKELGELLVNELCNNGITISYIIDKRKNEIVLPYPIYLPEENLPETDAIIVTAISDFEEIEHYLSSRVKAKIFSLKDIIFDCGS